MRNAPLVLGFSIAILLAQHSPASAVTRPLGTRETFLRVDPADIASGALILRLEDHSLFPGYTIRIRSLGDFDNGPGGDTFHTLDVVFSASATLLGSNLQFRVPDAVDAGLLVNTAPTCPNGLATNVPFDFFVTNAGVDVVIPEGSTHLFVGTWDCFYSDNTDPDGDFAVEITILSTGVGDATLRGAPSLVSWPNPARGSTTLVLGIPSAGPVELALHALDGRRVRTLVAGERGAGREFVFWDGRDDAGNRLPHGVYFARLLTARGRLERSIVLLR